MSKKSNLFGHPVVILHVHNLMKMTVFIVCRHAMHAEHDIDIVVPILSVCLSNAVLCLKESTFCHNISMDW